MASLLGGWPQAPTLSGILLSSPCGKTAPMPRPMQKGKMPCRHWLRALRNYSGICTGCYKWLWDSLGKPLGELAPSPHPLWNPAFKPLWGDSAKANAKRQNALQALADGPEELFGDLQKRLQVALGFLWQAFLGCWPQGCKPGRKPLRHA